MHLGKSTPITTVQDKVIVLTSLDGHNFIMKIDDLAEAVRKVMKDATVDSSGLMPADYKSMIAKTTGMKSVLVYETASATNTSILLSISTTSGGSSSLYYIDIYRPAVSGSVNPSVKIKVLYGTDTMKIKFKNNSSTGEFKLFIEWKQYTPVSSALLMNSMGSASARKLSMTLVEESELEGSEYATFV